MFNEKGIFFKCVDEFFEGKTTFDDIEKFEQKYNIKLENDYKKFLVKYNGFSINYCSEINNNQYFLFNIYFFCLNYMYPSIDNFETLKSVEFMFHDYLDKNSIEYKNEIITKLEIIPIANGNSGHFDLGIGYGKDNFGKIYTWYLEGFDGVIFVCNNFKEFIEGYYIIEVDDNGEIIGSEKIFTIDAPL